MFDSINEELMDLVGVDVQLYSLNRITEEEDPVYGEPKDRIRFSKPYTITGFVTKPDWIFEAHERGLRKETDSILTLSRKMMEVGSVPDPKIGDVVEFWEGKFDIIRAIPDGFLNDTSTFEQWIVDLKRHREYPAERKMD